MRLRGLGWLAVFANAKNGTLQDELVALVEAGLTPMQALKTATRNSAEFLGKLDSVGTVERGKSADLVLLDANPLDDIHNAARISAVILQGQIVKGRTDAR